MVVSAVAFAFGHIRLGGALLLPSGVVDTFDGQVARRGGMVSKFGAFYDSTLDRVGDGATFIGIAAYLLHAPGVVWRIETAVLCMVAILSSLLVSYARARAEGLGIDCKVGSVQRAERMLAIGVPSVLVGAGPQRHRAAGHRRAARRALDRHRGAAIRLRLPGHPRRRRRRS